MAQEATGKTVKCIHNGNGCKFLEIGKASGSPKSDKNKDPYVLRAMERAKNKLHTRLIELSGSDLN